MAEILCFREEQIEGGISLGQQYASLSDQGANPLRDLHDRLDVAVMEAYGFTEEDAPLAQLLALNKSIVEEEKEGALAPRRPGNVGLPETRLTDLKIVSDLELGQPA